MCWCVVQSVAATALRVAVRQINVASVQWDTLWTAVLCAMVVFNLQHTDCSWLLMFVISIM